MKQKIEALRLRFAEESGKVSTQDELENLRVAVRTEKESAVLYTADGTAQSLPCETDTADDGYRFVTVPRLPAYEMILIEV